MDFPRSFHLSAAICLFILLNVVESRIVLEGNQPKVDTDYGTVYGTVETLTSKKQILFFRGIPFAQPPVGSLRFEKPQKIRSFGVVNATKFAPRCVTFNYNALPGQEDCLYLNLAIPYAALLSPRLLPVVVMIVGGAHIHCDPDKQHTDHFHEKFVTRGIIFITFRHRVGPLGFYTDDRALTSNNELYDILEGLEFIQKTVSAFNGDPQRVTFFGYSSGATSVSLLSLSPLSRGLFHQTIDICGSAHIISNRGTTVFNSSRQVERLLGCGSVKDKLACMRNKTVVEMVKADLSDFLQIGDDIDMFRWAPTFYDEGLQLGDTFEDALKTAPKLAALYGLNIFEDTFAAMKEILPPGARFYPVLNSTATNFTRKDLVEGLGYLLTKNGVFGSNSEEAVDSIINFYDAQKSNNPEFGSLQKYVQLFSDLHYRMGSLREAKMRAKHGMRTYFYLNTFVHTDNPKYGSLLRCTIHCNETSIIFGVYEEKLVKTDPILDKVVQDFVDMWVHFIKYGVPKHSGRFLERVTAHRIPYVMIADETRFMDNLEPEKTAFWDNLAKKYGYDWITGSDNLI